MVISLFLIGNAVGTVTTITYVEYVDIWENYYGGRIYWVIDHKEAGELRALLTKNYDFNHDGELSISEVVKYIKKIRTILIGQLVGTVKITDATPLHGWYQGGQAIDNGDVKGLMGDLNSTGTIDIKMRFSGTPESNGNLNSLNLSKVPFAAAANTTVANFTLSREAVYREHTEIGLSLSSYENVPHALLFRLVMGSYYHYSGQIPQNESITRVTFSIWNSPLFLFIALLVSARVASIIEQRNYDRNVDKGSTFGRKKRISRLNFIIKIVLVVFYVLAAVYVFDMPGWAYLIFCVGYVLTLAIVSNRIYSSKIPSVKRGLLMVEDAFLLSKSGIMISHETRRLKPDVDEDILSSMLIAIQDFVKQSFKDESNVELSSITFGDKKIFLRRGKYLILAVVMRGTIDKYVEHHLGETLDEIETKYAATLPTWNGKVDEFRGVRNMLRKIWE